jgi:hydroxymethylpyrimidine synthase
MTQLQEAISGRITKEMEIVAQQECVSVEWLRTEIAKGTIVIPRNCNHNFIPRGMGIL